MLQHSRNLVNLVRSPASELLLQQATASTSFGAQQLRYIGGDKIPEFWGKPSKYTAGTDFLGTPKDHLETLKRRPLSPDVLEIGNKALHYKLPWGAISSITNRVTGVTLSVGFAGASYFALTGKLGGIVGAIAAAPVLAFPLKFVLSYTILYHYVGGLRHLIWDHSKIGNMAEKNSLLEVDRVEQSSKAIMGGSAVLAFIMALL